MDVCLHSNFRGRLRKTHVLCNGLRNGCSRSSNVIDFGTNRKRVCNFLLVINSNLGPLLLRFRDIAGFLLRTATLRYSTRILGVFLLVMDWISDVGDSRREVPILIIHVITFEIT